MADTHRSPVEIVKAFMKAIEKKDFDTALQYLSDDCQYENPPPLGKVRGPAGVRGVLEPFFAPTLENDFVLLRVVTDGPVVFTERLDRHRLEKGWVELPVVGVMEVHGGRITMWRDYFDTPTILNAWPAPSS